MERIEFNSDYDACKAEARRSFSVRNSVEQTVWDPKVAEGRLQFGLRLSMKVVLMAETKERKLISLAEQCI